MTVEEFIAKQEAARKEAISSIHSIIVKNNKRVKPEVDKMMGQEMIQYKLGGIFMYGLGGGKSHMSLHLLPMYGTPSIYTKYIKLLDKAKFQKGCVNFTKPEQMPLKIVEGLIKDCAKCEEVIIEKFKLRHKK
jgi:hypothetical protein